MKAENDAAVAALEAAWPAGHVYRVGAVPTTSAPPTPYAVVSVDSGLRRNYRGSSSATSRYYRISVQCVGASYDQAAFAAERADVAFLDNRLTIAGFAATPCRDETATSIQRDPDGGVRMYGLRTYTFTTNPV